MGSEMCIRDRGYSVREVVEEVILTNYVIAGEQLVARSLVQMV